MDKRIMSVFALIMLAGVSVAYNSSLVDPKRNWTSSDFTNALPDVLVKTSQQTSALELGQQIAKYLVYVLMAVVIAYFLNLARLRGWI